MSNSKHTVQSGEVINILDDLEPVIQKKSSSNKDTIKEPTKKNTPAPKSDSKKEPDSKKTPDKKKKLFLGILSAVAVLLCGFTIFLVSFLNRPQMKVVQSVFYFSKHTLKDPNYLFYDIDVMELMRQYFNCDVAYEGEASLHNIKDLGFNVSANISGIRSYDQRQMSCEGSISLLNFQVGSMECYVDDQKLYLFVPMLDMAYQIPIDADFFMKMPNLTSDINKPWFDRNKQNIKNLANEIPIEKTGEKITDANGESAEEYLVTIPKGKGGFIWDLLGMDYPKHDVIVSMYLTKKNHLSRMEIDLSHISNGMRLTIDGTQVNTFIFENELPDNETVTMTVTRDGRYSHYFHVASTFHAKTGEDYQVNGDISWTNSETGFDLKLKEFNVTCEDELYATLSFIGSVTPLEETPDVLKNIPQDPSTLESIEWSVLRDNTESAIEEMLGFMNNVFF